MRTIKLAIAVLTVLLCATNNGDASIIEISVPESSQANSRPAIDGVWDAVAVGGVLDIDTGIGLIVNPIFVSANDQSDFALHQNAALGSPAYVAGYIPDPQASTVVYHFDQSTIVSSVDIIQHINGVTALSASIGDSLGSLTSLGTVFGPAGNLLDPSCTSAFIDGSRQTFNFNNSTEAGTYFALTVAKSSCPAAFALHREFLYDEGGRAITALNEPASVSEPRLLGLTSSAIVFVLLAYLHTMRTRRPRPRRQTVRWK
jgi:hypothetical protein